MRGFKSYRGFLALSVFAILSGPNARAACTGSSPTWTATDDDASIQACVSNAKAGDTINVSAGTSTWTSDVSVNKNVNIIGAGQGVTIVNGGHGISITNVSASGSTVSARISGFTFNLAGNAITVIDAVNFRYDHDDFIQTSQANCILSYSNNGTVNEGLFDHDTFTYCQQESLGGDYGNDNNGDNLAWSRVNPVGTSHNIFYEDDTFTVPDPTSNGYFNCWDAYQGGSYVVRFSNLDGCRFEGHGLQGDNTRAMRAFEIYNLTMVNSHGISGYSPFFQRGGTGMIFHNTLDANWLNGYARIDTDRAEEDSIASQLAGWQFCDGRTQSLNTGGFTFSGPKTIIIDAQGPGGYRCRDQLGAGGDISTWAPGWNTTPPSQGLAPAYIWKNQLGSGEMPVVITCEASGDALCINDLANIIVPNRDYYLYNAVFDGTSGVGEGTLANRPSTCITGVGYWATDQGNWNAKLAANTSGQFYKCTSTNTWTAYYTPYTYPHPLQAGTTKSSVQPPTSLTAVVQ